MPEGFTANGKEYIYAMVLGRLCLCEKVKPKPSKKKKPK